MTRKRLKIFDFDGTLVWTPSAETPIDGVPALKVYDRWLAREKLPPRRWKGWWGRKETLMPPVFGRLEGGKLVCPDDLLNRELAATLADYRRDAENLVVLMTGRHAKMTRPDQTHVCRAILDGYGLDFDQYHYNAGGDTLQFKCTTLDRILGEHPAIDDVEIFEDRPAHVSKFFEWIKLRRREGHISRGNVVTVHPPWASFGEGGEE